MVYCYSLISQKNCQLTKFLNPMNLFFYKAASLTGYHRLAECKAKRSDENKTNTVKSNEIVILLGRSAIDESLDNLKTIFCVIEFSAKSLGSEHSNHQQY